MQWQTVADKRLGPHLLAPWRVSTCQVRTLAPPEHQLALLHLKAEVLLTGLCQETRAIRVAPLPVLLP